MVFPMGIDPNDVAAYDEFLSRITVGTPQPAGGPITISDYDPGWPELYAREAERLRRRAVDSQRPSGGIAPAHRARPRGARSEPCRQDDRDDNNGVRNAHALLHDELIPIHGLGQRSRDRLHAGKIN